LFFYIIGVSLVYFLCTRVVPLCAFIEFELLIQKKKKNAAEGDKAKVEKAEPWAIVKSV